MSLTLDRLGEGVEQNAERASADRERTAFRADIQGLRAVAVTVVVLYHCGVGFLGGGFVGVDVFFVISGFLITGHLLAELRRTGRVSVTGFYARRVRRLLPPALVVLVTTVVLARVFGPALQAGRTTTDGFWTLLYAMNYRLADQGVDYSLVNAAPSPLQHFWSLAVEEQFYVVWPLLLLAVGWLTTRARPWTRTGLVAVLVASVVGVSLVVSVQLTVANPPLAYYALQSRAWELGVGAALAVALPLLTRAPRALAAVATWVGLAGIGYAVVTFSDATAFPGTAALLPVLGAALVIAGGTAHPAYGVERVLRGRLTQLVGNVSYGWYLWHWPALVLGPALFGHEFSLLENLEISLLSLWFAILTYLLLERPMPRLRIPVQRWLGIGLSASLVAGLALGTVLAVLPEVRGAGLTATGVDVGRVGLAGLRTAFVAERHDPVPANLEPSLAEASADVPPTSRNGCHVALLATTQPGGCVWGDPTASRTILLFGDSHAEQWFGAVDAIAKQEGYRLVSWTKIACPLAAVPLEPEQLGREYTECTTWRADRMRAIAALRPDVIVASQADSLLPPEFDDATWADATVRTLRRLAADTERLVFLGDTPRAEDDVPTCLSQHLDDATGCAVEPGRSGSEQTRGYLGVRSRVVAGAVRSVALTRVDPVRWTCRAGSCPAVVGNALVYRDDAHLTQHYSRLLAPLLRPAIFPATTPGVSTPD